MSPGTQWLLTAALAFTVVPGNALAEERFSRAFVGTSSTANSQEASAETDKPCLAAAVDNGAPADQGAYAMIVSNLAEIYAAQGKYYQAALLYEKWLARLENAPESGAAAVRGAAKRYWLVALKDGTVRIATDYWTEGNTLHYMLREGTKSTAPLSDVDVPFTKQLNQERGMEFRLPGPSAAK